MTGRLEGKVALITGTGGGQGRAAALRFARERIASAGIEGCPAGTILRHKALLRLPDGHPVSLVIECYTRANLR